MKAAIVLLLFFLTVQFLGLMVSDRYLELVEKKEAELLFSNPQSIWNSLYLFAVLLPLTLFVLFLLKFKARWFGIFEVMVIFFCCWLTLDLLIGAKFGWFPLGFFLSLLLVGWRMIRPSHLNRDLVLILSSAGVGAVLGVSLSPLPGILLLALFSVYDYFSVFVSKHMVFMAERLVPSSSSLLLSVPKNLGEFLEEGKPVGRGKGKIFYLGGGDLILPLLFSSSVFACEGLLSFLLVSFSSALFLLFLLLLLHRKPGRIFPGLPFLSAGCLLGFLLSELL
ncbi:MAG: presenilin family intramembrane aspartyl protease [Candidatus Hadarchaeales archaeon]